VIAIIAKEVVLKYSVKDPIARKIQPKQQQNIETNI
jgi:hypothetical protein